MNEQEHLAAIVAYGIVAACRPDASSRSLMLSTAGRVAIAVSSPLKGVSREMVFVRSGLALGIISPVNNPEKFLSDGGKLEVLDGENHGVGTPEESDMATAMFR